MLKQQDNNNHIFSECKDDSPESIECRWIYAKLKKLKSPQSPNTVMITSSISGEGKSTISTLLAITCAKYEMRNTLLIDFDLRRPNIHKIIGLAKEDGIAEILKGEVSIKETIKNTNIDNLKIITSGYLEESPTELLKLSRIKDLFEELKNNFETIIIDTPPVLPVSDSLILSSVADSTVIIIKVGKTKREIVKRAIDLLKDTGVDSINIIVNNYNNVLPYYYDYKYYGYK